MNDLTNASSTASRNVSPEALVDRLFQRFSTMYGRGWLDMWVGIPMDAIKADWAASLTGVEPEAMRLAIETLMTEGKPFPPTQPQFVSLCRQFRRRGAHQLSLVDKRPIQGPAGGFESLRAILAKAQQ
ncbi:MAG: hypothetical protein ABI624_06615 [Casimicrobiaceae bacterium]